MALLTYYDIVGKEEFRRPVFERLSKKLALEGRPPYKIPATIPVLYKYRSMSEYAVDDVVSGNLTFSSVEEFNDIFDSSIHTACTDEVPSGRNRIDFSVPGLIGTYILCMSKTNTSNLMWAHYADNNSGFCTGYDFNVFSINAGARQTLFPVAYTDTPIDVKDLMNDSGHELCDYPVDTAVQCAILNKSVEWSYEKEWRAVFIPNNGFKERRVTLPGAIKPSCINLGYHFLRPVFLYPQDEGKIKEKSIRHLNNVKRLISFCGDGDIELSVMTPDIGSFSLLPKKVEPAKLLNFIDENMKITCHIKNYCVTLDRLESMLR